MEWEREYSIFERLFVLDKLDMWFELIWYDAGTSKDVELFIYSDDITTTIGVIWASIFKKKASNIIRQVKSEEIAAEAYILVVAAVLMLFK